MCGKRLGGGSTTKKRSQENPRVNPGRLCFWITNYAYCVRCIGVCVFSTTVMPYSEATAAEISLVRGFQRVYDAPNGIVREGASYHLLMSDFVCLKLSHTFLFGT